MIIATSALMALALVSQPNEAFRGRVVVFNVKGPQDLAGLSQRATEQILLHLGKKVGITAIGEAEIQILVQHAEDKDSLQACGEGETCLAAMSRTAEADKLLVGNIGHWGNGFLATLSVTDSKKGVVERGDSATADNEKELIDQVRALVDRLLGLGGAETKPQFSLGTRATKLAVINLAAYDTTPELADNLTQLLALELKKLDNISVISRDEIKAMLQYETQKQIAQCKSDVSCLVEIGGALGVEYLVSGGVGKLADTYVVHLKLMDINKAEVVNRVSESFRGPETQLVQAIRFAAKSLMNQAVDGTGGVNLAASVDPAEASIDGAPNVTIPKALSNIPTGKHTLSVSAENHYTRFQEFYVEPGVDTKMRVELEALPAAWYEQWWPWVIIGGVVAAGVTATVLVARDSPDTGSVEIGIRQQ